MTSYEILGVPPGATDEEIRAAYKRKIAAAHPDRGGNTEEAAAINKAYHDLTTEPPEPDDAAMSRKILAQTFNNVLALGIGGDYDLVAAMRSEVQSAIIDLHARCHSCNTTVKMLEKIQKKMDYKGKTGNPVLLDLIAHHITGLKEDIQRWKLGIEDLERTIQMIDEYEWVGGGIVPDIPVGLMPWKA